MIDAVTRLTVAKCNREALRRKEVECGDAIRAAVEMLQNYVGEKAGSAILTADAINELVESVTWEKRDEIDDEICAAEDALDEEIAA